LVFLLVGNRHALFLENKKTGATSNINTRLPLQDSVRKTLDPEYAAGERQPAASLVLTRKQLRVEVLMFVRRRMPPNLVRVSAEDTLVDEGEFYQ
jgi:hypothetical protein